MPLAFAQHRRSLPNVISHCQTSPAIAHSSHYPKSPNVFLHCPFWPLPKKAAAGIHEAIARMKGIETPFHPSLFFPILYLSLYLLQ
jgi:hypothetical protein